MPYAPPTPPSTGPQPPSTPTMLASLCAAACIGAVVWSIYAAFGQQIFDLRQAVLQPVRAWAAAPHGLPSPADPQGPKLLAAHAPIPTSAGVPQ